MLHVQGFWYQAWSTAVSFPKIPFTSTRTADIPYTVVKHWDILLHHNCHSPDVMAKNTFELPRELKRIGTPVPNSMGISKDFSTSSYSFHLTSREDDEVNTSWLADTVSSTVRAWNEETKEAKRRLSVPECHELLR